MAEPIRSLAVRVPPSANPPRPAPWRKPRIIEIDDARKLIFQYFKLVGQARRNRAEQAEYEQCQQAVSRLQPEIIAEVVFPLRETGRVEIYDLLPNNLRKAVVAAVNEIEFGPGYVAPAAPAIQVPPPPVSPVPPEPVQAEPARPAAEPGKVDQLRWEIDSHEELGQLFPEVLVFLMNNEGRVLILGRHSDTNVHLTFDPAISARHARIGYENGQFWIEDIGSMNGTYVNGRRIGKNNKVFFKEGDYAELGRATRLYFTLPEPVLEGVTWEANDPDELRTMFPHVVKYLLKNPGRELIVGRKRKYADVIIKHDSMVSGKHVKIGYDGQHFWIEDLGSMNGVFYNGQIIEPNQRIIIREGEAVFLGRSALCFSRQAPSVTPERESAVPEPDEAATELEPFAGREIPVVSDWAIALRERVRRLGQLLFTRNIDLQEFADIAKSSGLRLAGKGEKDFRLGVSHEYGLLGEVLTIVMKPQFLERVKGRASLVNMFLPEINGQGIRIGNADLDSPQATQILQALARQIEFNRLLGTRHEQADPGGDGSTVIGLDHQKFMGNFPQLEVYQDVGLDQVERILVPEHLWEQVTRIAAGNSRLLALLHKVEGTGKTRDEFVAGREKMGRRTSRLKGRYKPNIGYEAFHLFEQRYLETVLAADFRPPETAGLTPYLAASSNADFRAGLPDYQDFVRLIPAANPLHQLIGLQQNPSHEGLDPLQHTYNALRVLDTDMLEQQIKIYPAGIRRPIVELVRIAMLYHDVGKLYGATDPNHPRASVQIAAEILDKPEISGVGPLTDEERSLVLTLIGTHNLFSDFNKYKVATREAIRKVCTELVGPFTPLEMFLLHLTITTADVYSIPIVRKRINPQRWTDYANQIFAALS
jgi:pSer/pThr/pTyr-binding forkhead associated (FHA) protein